VYSTRTIEKKMTCFEKEDGRGNHRLVFGGGFPEVSNLVVRRNSCPCCGFLKGVPNHVVGFFLGLGGLWVGFGGSES